MKNQFIPYQQALELKELGFDEECFDYYIPNGKAISDIFNNNFELKKYNSETNHIYGSIGLVSRPLWQQAFNWFREKHNLCSWVYQTNSGLYHYSILKEDRFLLSSYNNQTKYQEARLECLKKLIELCKKH